VTPRQIGPYPIEREVGRGGMGVVYLGRDPRLDRPVAIKVLPEGFVRDPERLARFEREARLLAALTHPNIAGIYSLEESAGERFLALEYVEGETLAERLARGPLPLEETLEVGRQVAAALEAAHEAGIVHRDLKPGNVKLTPAGDVKVLDFGLAKSSASTAESSPDLSQSPTLTYGATGAGVILGTAAYMSPEQARGKPVDRRTDIWSFGALVYECLTGTQAFAGETVSDTIAMILQGAPDWSKLPAKTPDKLRMLMTRCLERDARGRLRDIGDARIEIEELLGSRVTSASRMAAAAAPALGGSTARPARMNVRTIAIGAGLLLVGAIVGAALYSNVGPPRSDGSSFRFTVQAPPQVQLVSDPNEQAISPDGRTLAFVAQDSAGNNALWVRPLGDFEARTLPGTRNAALPFWSPDGRQIGFFADGKLKRTRVVSGNPEPICDAATGRGASWSPKDVIVFSPSPSGPLFKVKASGGTPEAVTVVDTAKGESAHRWPCFLPDGEHFVYAALPARTGLFACFVGSLGSTKRTALITATNAPVYAAPGHLVFVRNEALLAQRFDPGARKVSGDPFSIGDPPGASDYSAGPGVSASTNGVIAWQTPGRQESRMYWAGRDGREIANVDVPLDRWLVAAISPDGRFADAIKNTGTGVNDLWVIDLARGVSNRITNGKSTNNLGAWSPDSKALLYGSNRRGPRDVYRRAADGSGEDEVFYQSQVPFKDADDCSPDGKWVVLNEISDENGWNLVLIPATGGSPTPYLVTPANEQFGQISPDGKWLLYVSDETGSGQAFVQSFPTPGHKQQVSKTGAFYAVWNRKGGEILILRNDLSMLSVPVTLGPDPSFGAPRELFRLPSDTRSVFPAPDGQRFLVLAPAVRTVPGISVAVNWNAGHDEK